MQVEFAGQVWLLQDTVKFPAPHVTQAPLTQPFGQVLPQCPQFFGSVSRLVQLVQAVSPLGQVQAPFEHVAPIAQTLPQVPQFVGSVCVLVQALLQRISLPGQPQVLALHAKPPGQSLPHPPQFLGSVAVSTHSALQAVAPPGHPHPPAWQLAPGGHTTPHEPQCCGSVLVSTHCVPQVCAAGQTHEPASQTYPAGQPAVLVHPAPVPEDEALACEVDPDAPPAPPALACEVVAGAPPVPPSPKRPEVSVPHEAAAPARARAENAARMRWLMVRLRVTCTLVAPQGMPIGPVSWPAPRAAPGRSIGVRNDRTFAHVKLSMARASAPQRLGPRSVTGPHAARLRHLAGLPVTHLVLDGTAVSDAGLDDLARMSGLSRVSLCGTRVTDEAVRRSPVEAIRSWGCIPQGLSRRGRSPC
jgi:hypothetical protein